MQRLTLQSLQNIDYKIEYKNLDDFNTLSKLIGYYFQGTTDEFPISIGKLEPKSDDNGTDNLALHLNYSLLLNMAYFLVYLKQFFQQLHFPYDHVLLLKVC